MPPRESPPAPGMTPECAMDAVAWYTFQGDDEGLEKYVRDVEEHNRRNEV